MFYFGLIVVMVVFWWYFLSLMNMFVFYLLFSLLDLCVCYLSFLYLGMLVLCGYLLVIFGTCVCYLSFLHLGMSVVCLLVHLGFGFRFLIWGCCFVFIWMCSLMSFLLATTDLLERCFCYLCGVFVSSCFYLSMSKCKLQTVDLFPWVESAFQYWLK